MCVYLNSRGVDIKLLEDGESLLIEFIADSNVSDVRSIVVIQAVDILHHSSAVCFNGCQNQKVLQVSVSHIQA